MVVQAKLSRQMHLNFLKRTELMEGRATFNLVNKYDNFAAITLPLSSDKLPMFTHTVIYPCLNGHV